MAPLISYKKLILISFLNILFFSISSGAENCPAKGVKFFGWAGYARKEHGKFVFSGDFLEIGNWWSRNSNDYKKIYLSFDSTAYENISKAKFVSEFQSEKRIIKKEAPLLPATTESFHEIKNLNFYNDVLNKTTVPGILIVKFLYDNKIICTQEISVKGYK